jgi:hypothetical protein
MIPRPGRPIAVAGRANAVGEAREPGCAVAVQARAKPESTRAAALTDRFVHVVALGARLPWS